MRLVNSIYGRFKGLRTRDKVKVVLAATMTAAFLAAAPAVAWFANQKRLATMAKIDSPSKLSLKAGAGDDIIQFKMSGIDIRDGSPQDFIFCVEGEDISKYKLQLAHTTNINFSYSIYKAKEAETGIPYVPLEGDTIYYKKQGDAIPISSVNGTADTYSSRTLGTDSYEEPSYKSTDKRQRFAEPLYWQTNEAIIANDADYDELDDDDSAFRNYYVLEVSWGADVTNNKETDMIYLTAQVAQ